MDPPNWDNTHAKNEVDDTLITFPLQIISTNPSGLSDVLQQAAKEKQLKSNRLPIALSELKTNCSNHVFSIKITFFLMGINVFSDL